MGKRQLILAGVLFLCLTGLGMGCNRQDRECLSGIGRKLYERASAATANCRERLTSTSASAEEKID